MIRSIVTRSRGFSVFRAGLKGEVARTYIFFISCLGLGFMSSLSPKNLVFFLLCFGFFCDSGIALSRAMIEFLPLYSFVSFFLNWSYETFYLPESPYLKNSEQSFICWGSLDSGSRYSVELWDKELRSTDGSSSISCILYVKKFTSSWLRGLCNMLLFKSWVASDCVRFKDFP